MFVVWGVPCREPIHSSRWGDPEHHLEKCPVKGYIHKTYWLLQQPSVKFENLQYFLAGPYRFPVFYHVEPCHGGIKSGANYSWCWCWLMLNAGNLQVLMYPSWFSRISAKIMKLWNSWIYKWVLKMKHPTCFPTNHTRWAPTIVINGVITSTRVSMEVGNQLVSWFIKFITYLRDEINPLIWAL